MGVLDAPFLGTRRASFGRMDIRKKMLDERAAVYDPLGQYGGIPSIQSWWDRYAGGQLRMVSPNLDGTDLHFAFQTPFDVIRKALSTGTAGAWNPLFSYLLQTQIVQEPNTYNAMPKEPWRDPRTFGWRVKTAAAVASNVGMAEGAAVPADADITPLEVEPQLKEHAHAWGMTRRLQDAVSIADTIQWDQDVEQHTLDFFKAFNKDLWRAVFGVEGNHAESLRNLLSSNAEITAKAGAANSVDPWTTIDRDAGASWADANALFASAADRDLGLHLIDALREAQEPFWEGPDKLAGKVFLTKYNTHGRWSRIEAAKQRFGTEFAEISFNGVKAAAGAKTGFKVSQMDGMVVIRDDDVTSETIGDIGLIDTRHWKLSQLRPFEMADESNPFITGFARRAVWYGSINPTATHFKGSGILTDLK